MASDNWPWIAALIAFIAWLLRGRVATMHRARQREVDVRVLWPALWRKADGVRYRFLAAAYMHTAMDPAWACSKEWIGSAQDPAGWVPEVLGDDDDEGGDRGE